MNQSIYYLVAGILGTLFFLTPPQLPGQDSGDAKTLNDQNQQVNNQKNNLPARGPLILNTSRETRKKDHQQLRQLQKKFEQAVNSGEIEQLKPYLHEKFVGIMINGRTVKSFAELKTFWTNMMDIIGDKGSYSVNVKPATYTQFYGNIGFNYGTSKETVKMADGRKFVITSNWSAVVKKVNGQWKILRMQATLNPFDNKVIEANLSFTRWVYGGVALVIGLLLGGAIGWFWGRKTTT